MENKQYCSYTKCNMVWDTQEPDCKCGESDVNKCQNYIGSLKNEPLPALKAGSQRKEIEVNIPWHSNAMGELDMAWVSAKRAPFVIGMIGQADSGKTTLLATLYMLLRNGHSVGNLGFAGSYTLLGWEKIANFLSFHTHQSVYFPPHTSANEARLPGLLHLLLKDKTGQHRDILLTDAPGEWFTNWALRTDAEESKGARWIDQNADAFIIVADTVAFGKSAGTSRNNLLSIVEKMRNTVNNRPSVLVWTKADQEIDAEIKNNVSSKVLNNLPHIVRFDTAVINLNNETEYLRDQVKDVFSYVLSSNTRPQNRKITIDIDPENDFFIALRLIEHE